MIGAGVQETEVKYTNEYKLRLTETGIQSMIWKNSWKSA